MSQFQKHFTVEEANRLLPELRQLLTAIQGLRQKLVVDVEGAGPVLRALDTNGGGKEIHPYLNDVHALNGRLQHLLQLGVQLKDLDRGLVDFPAWRGGEEILLCWHLGEERVAYWHDLESGIAGRQPL